MLSQGSGVAVVFLCSDATTYITGQPLVINGGFTAN
ncbi:SDR family oxidoreductase [Nodosilinea sp. LEGE 07298]